MKLTKVLATLGIIVAVHGVSAQNIPGNKKVIKSYHDFILPQAQTLRQRLNEIDAVAVVKIVGPSRTRLVQRSLSEIAEFREFGRGDDLPPSVITEYRAQVLDILKSHAHAGLSNIQISILQIGGEADWKTYHLVSHSNNPTLSDGRTYLVFLTYSESNQGMMVEPFDVFLADQGTIETTALSHPKYAETVIGGRSDEVIRIIRQAVDANLTQH